MGMMRRTFRSWRRPWWVWRALSNRRDRLSGGAAPELVFSASSFPEDTAVGTVIAALSVDNLGDLTVSSYAVTADPDNKFAIDGTNLEIDAEVDYETDTSHSVTVTATLSDASEVEGTQVFTVTDVEDDFTPLDLTPAAWYDPSDLTTLFQDSSATTPVTADGDVVGYMADKSGNGRHMTQATTASKPLYKTAGGLHWLQFDDTDDSLTAGVQDLSSTDKLTFFIGARKLADTAADEIIGNASGASTTAGGFSIGSGSSSGDASRRTWFAETFGTVALFVETVGPHAAPDSVALTVLTDNSTGAAATNVVARRNGAVANVLFNSASATTAGNYSASRTVRIGRRNNATLPFGGYLYGLIFLMRTATAGEISDTEAWVAPKAGVTL